MVTFLSKNPYKGINAHFQSCLQNPESEWSTFHNDHITDLKRAINRVLPVDYYAVTEKSFQVTDEDIYFAVVEIYHMPASRFVTCLVLLSPGSKTLHLQNYLDMRQAMLKLGVNMIEVDYLHETPSIFRDILPDYTKNAEGAYPYCISIANPYHEKLSLYCFHLEDSIPVLTIPLKGEESFTLDFGAVYNYTFEDDRRAHMLIDYEQLPVNFASYSPADRAKIQAVMDTSTKNP